MSVVRDTSAACRLGSGFCHGDTLKVTITRDKSVVKYWVKDLKIREEFLKPVSFYFSNACCTKNCTLNITINFPIS
jgi:hypothetical protein